MADASQAEQIRAALFRALNLGAEGSTVQDAVSSQLDVLVAMVPEPYVWAVIGHGEDSRLLLLAAAALFSIRLRGKWTLMVSRTSREVRWVEHWRERERDGHVETAWKFGLRRCDEPIRIDGKTSSDGPDDAEKFARALADWIIEDASA